MAEQRLIDANAFKDGWSKDSTIGKTMRMIIDERPTIDPETLPVVKQLRSELNELNEKYQMLERAYKANRTVHALVCCNAKIAEIKLNAAIEQLRGDCEKCAHYRVTWNGCTPDFECPLSDRCLNGDMWEWKGAEQNP